MPTTFIAVQCFECSTMQVKQQKKSSNKWICVVCNQKQSVRKVFAQASMARDVRKFVQTFNMSRQFSDQNQFNLSDEHDRTSDNSPIHEQTKKMKRNDWTEYVDNDDQEEYRGKFHIDDEDRPQDDEPIIVTEMPKALFKKPKVKGYSSNGGNIEKLFKPTFPNRSNSKKHQNEHCQDIHLAELEQTSDYATRVRIMEPTPSNQSDLAHKWNRFKEQIQDKNTRLTNMDEPFVQKPTKEINGSISKWNAYITPDDDENTATEEPNARFLAVEGRVSKWSSFITEEKDDDLENIGSGNLYQRVEDDIHPDFL
ncbi:hypothetical protein ABFX02_03G011600 [Erythranthe guttata]